MSELAPDPTGGPAIADLLADLDRFRRPAERDAETPVASLHAVRRERAEQPDRFRQR